MKVETMVVYKDDKEVIINVEHYELWKGNGWSKDAPKPKKDLSKVTKDELIAFAKENDIEIDADAKKADILAAIQAAAE